MSRFHVTLTIPLALLAGSCRQSSPATSQREPSGMAASQPGGSSPPVLAPRDAAPATPSDAGAPESPATCSTDQDCGFDDPCVPKRCVAAVARSDIKVCDKSFLATGDCRCFHNRCALHPHADHKAVAVDRDCSSATSCALDLAAGSCAPGHTAEGVPSAGLGEPGPRCNCDGKLPSRCHFLWLEPVACKSTRDCWVDHDPIPHPIKRPPQIRRDFKACVDGELVPTCQDGVCGLLAAGC
ncbi:MAG: hypothetical protein H6Q90_2941 [Deltaproteobacteria bacterium]|nr:hypothetical protein [Deltaproteobacteria bacterium]